MIRDLPRLLIGKQSAGLDLLRARKNLGKSKVISTVVDIFQPTRAIIGGDMSTSNCVPGKPLMDLGKGEAPTLDYDIPQRSCFSSLGRILLDIPEDWFLDDWKKEPSDHWWKI
ncbi:MAG: hypothetical protein RPU39_15620, partial [Candidatus Sedimenticola sp. (ex Thyasira tokunagai)]